MENIKKETAQEIEMFQNRLKIYKCRIENLIKEANELISNGQQLGNCEKFYPEFESIGGQGNLGFVCLGTSLKLDSRFKIRGVGISQRGVFGKPFILSISNNELNVEITESIFNDFEFQNFENFEMLFETFEKRFYEFVDKK
jgi:hypothetical protein